MNAVTQLKNNSQRQPHEEQQPPTPPTNKPHPASNSTPTAPTETDKELSLFRDKCIDYQSSISNIGKNKVAKAIEYGSYLNEQYEELFATGKELQGQWTETIATLGLVPKTLHNYRTLARAAESEKFSEKLKGLSSLTLAYKLSLHAAVILDADGKQASLGNVCGGEPKEVDEWNAAEIARLKAQIRYDALCQKSGGTERKKIQVVKEPSDELLDAVAKVLGNKYEMGEKPPMQDTALRFISNGDSLRPRWKRSGPYLFHFVVPERAFVRVVRTTDKDWYTLDAKVSTCMALVGVGDRLVTTSQGLGGHTIFAGGVVDVDKFKSAFHKLADVLGSLKRT